MTAPADDVRLLADLRRCLLELLATSAMPPQSVLPGRHLSPLEQAVWDAVAAGPLLGKQIARKIGHKDSPSFRAILGNLARRGVLLTGPQGYARAPLQPAEAAE